MDYKGQKNHQWQGARLDKILQKCKRSYYFYMFIDSRVLRRFWQILS